MTVGGSGIEYPLTDGLGSVRQLTDSSGNVILSRSYDAFGNLRYRSGTGMTHLGYTGELQDLTTGLVYLRARFYHPVLGRFLQRDSFAGFGARPQSINRYSYTENNPVNYTDPSGHYVDTLFDIGSIGYDLYRIVQDNILHDCDNLGRMLFLSCWMSVVRHCPLPPAWASCTVPARWPASPAGGMISRSYTKL